MKKLNPRNLLFAALLLSVTLSTVFLVQPFQKDDAVAEKSGILKERKEIKKATKRARAEYFERMLRDPKTKEIPANIRRLELAHAATMPKRLHGLSKSDAMPEFSWSEAGPIDVGGRTRALAVDVTNSNTIIAGGVTGGIWKSTDGGSTWSLKTDAADAAGITYIAQDPRPGNTNNWYATTGEFAGASGSDRGFRAPFYGNGIYESNDNGESWTLLSSNDPDPTAFNNTFDYVTKIKVSPATGTIFIASNGFGLNRAPTSPTNVAAVLRGDIFPLWTDFDIAPDGTLIAVISDGFFDSTTNFEPGVYRSTNDGVSWTNITPIDFPDSTPGLSPATPDRSVVAMAPSNPNVAYVLTFTGNVSNANNAFDETEEMMLFKMDIAAGTSVNLSSNLPDFGGQVGEVYTQRGFDQLIAVKPDDENFVVIGGINLFVSRDGFATKPTNASNAWVGGYSTANNLTQFNNHHADQHEVFFDPQNPNALWSAHDGGISYVADVTTVGPFAWESKSNGYNTTQFFHVSLPADPSNDRILGGTQDNGSPFFSFDPSTGITTNSSDVSSGDGSYSFLGQNYAIASTQNGSMEAFSYTETGDLLLAGDITPAGANGQLFINPFVTDPISETIIYYTAGNSLWRRNAGSISNNQWAQLASLQLTSAYDYTALATGDNGSSTTLYLGASGTDILPKIFRFDNAATSTSGAMDVSIPSGPSGSATDLADAYVHDIAVHPDNPNELLVAMSNYNIVGLYHSSDAGASWTAVEGNLTGSTNVPGPSVRSVGIVALNNATGYLVGTSTGFYSTTVLNGNSTSWQQEAATEMGNVIVENIAVRPADGRVALATHGRGIFVGMPLNPVSVEDEIVEQPALFELNQNYPNPFNPSTSISFDLSTASRVTLKVFDVTGREVNTLLANEVREKGAHQIDFSASDLPSGSYMYQLEAVSLASSQSIHRESKMMTLAK